MEDDFFNRHIKDVKCSKCESENIQLASMGHPMHFDIIDGQLQWIDEDEQEDIWYGGSIVIPGMDISFNRRCKDCHNLFRVGQ